MPQAIQMHQYGDPHVLHLAEVTLPPLQPDEIRFRVIAAAVNRADIEIRSFTRRYGPTLRLVREWTNHCPTL